MAARKTGTVKDEATGADQGENGNDTRVEAGHEAIARRAYELYCEWGQEDGQDLAHWFEAERQLTAEKTNRPGTEDNPRDAAAAGL